VAQWRFDADDPLAPLRRKSRGANAPTIWWRLYADDEMAP